MLEDIARMKAKVAFEKGVDSAEYYLLYNAWIEALCERGIVRPPVENVIYRNGIQFILQSVKGREYRYVPPDKFDETKFCIELEPLRDFILSEIRIQAKALFEAKVEELQQTSNNVDEVPDE